MSIKNDKQDAEAKAKADAEAKAKADEEAANADRDDQDDSDDQGDEDDEDEGDSSSKKIDYKAELEKEKEARKKAESLIAFNKYKGKHKKDDEEEDEDDHDDEDDDKPLTRKQLTSILEENRQKTIRETNAERILELATEMADSPEEAELIVEIHKNRQYPSHLSMREQVEEAQAVANRKKLVSQKSELARALQGKRNVSKDNSGTFRDGQEGAKPKMASQDEASYKRAGFAYDTKDRLWKKKLPNGKFLIKDPKTKATYIK